MRATRSCIAPALAGAITLLVLVPSASAFKYVSKGKTFDQGTIIFPSLTAKCPRGFKVLGGGLFNDSGLTPRVQMLDTAPADGPDRKRRRDDAWKASAYVEPGGEVQVVVWAICAKGRAARSLEHRSRSRRADTGQQRLKVGCPSGSRVVSGGLSTPPEDDQKQLWIASLAPADGRDRGARPNDAYAVALDNYEGTATRLTAHAVCADGRFGRGLEVKRETVTPGPPVARLTVTAGCDQRDQVVGGGLRTTAPLGDAIYSASSPADSLDPGGKPSDGWLGIFENYDAQPDPITAFAICG